MVAVNFNTENRTYRQLLSYGLTYRIPPFQRDYSWEEEQWEDLWEDIQGMLPAEGEQAHYMGFLVLQTEDNRVYDVIDGQQRLTTISLIVLGAMRLLKKLAVDGKKSKDNLTRLEQLRATYIAYLDPVTLTVRNKLSLNRNNDNYYRDFLVPLIPIPILPQRDYPASTHAMLKCFESFERRLGDLTRNAVDPGVALAQFVENLSDKLFFTVITVADPLNAYKVFETLNARGVRLSATDLLKNYLFSALWHPYYDGYEMDDLERRWEAMIERLGSECFPDFLRMHWNSRHSFSRQTELFKIIRNHIQYRGNIFSLLRGLEEDIDAYLALTQPDDAQWGPACKQYAQDLRMFCVRQPYPMLMAAKRKLSDADFEDLLRATVFIAFRSNVIGAQNTAEQERVYNAAAMKLNNGKSVSCNDILESLKKIYLSDQAFRSDFAEKIFKTTQSRNAKVVRYILYKLEKQAGGAEFDMNSSSYTIEHVLPQAPQSGWDAFSYLDLENFVYRLGNMAMLESVKNKDIGNKPYSEKRPVFQQSALLLTRKLAEENAQWEPDRVIARQKKLANLATSIWRIAQFD